MSIDRPWLQNYPAGVPHTIDPDKYSSINDMVKGAIAQHGDKQAFECMGKAITYDTFDREADKFASFLQNTLGLKKGDRVAVMMPNCLQQPIATFGILRAGMTVVNVNPL